MDTIVSKSRRKRVAARKAEMAKDEYFRKGHTESRAELRRAFGADFLYYDIFSQLWGWGKDEDAQDPKTAVQRLQKAMQKQRRIPLHKQRPLNGSLQFQVGVAYLNGWIGNANRKQTAAAWFQRSADQGAHQGIMALGYCYEKGIGGYPKDLDAAVALYVRAAKKGNEPARYRYARLLFENTEQCTPEEKQNQLEEIEDLLSEVYTYEPADKLMRQVLKMQKEYANQRAEEEAANAQKAGHFQQESADEENPDTVLLKDDKLEACLTDLLGQEAAAAWMEQIQVLDAQMRKASNDEFFEVYARYEEAMAVLDKQIDHALSQQESPSQAEASRAEANQDTPVSALTPDNKERIRALISEVVQEYINRDDIGEIRNGIKLLTERQEQGHRLALDTNQIVRRSEETLGEVQKDVRSAKEILEGIQKAQKQMWQELLASEAPGKEQGRYIQQLQMQMTGALAKISSRYDSPLEQEEKYLRLIFGSDWRNESRLCNTSCDHLLTAQVLMRYGSKIGIPNYAGIIITAISALETETRRRFFDEYVKYLEEQHTKPEDFPANLTYHKKADGSFYYTLGSLKYILSAKVNGENTLSDEMAGQNAPGRTLYTPDGDPYYYDNRVDDFLSKRIMSEYAKSIQKNPAYDRAYKVFQYYVPAGSDQSFVDCVNTINFTYRNKSAHADEAAMTREAAEKCCTILGIGISAERYAQLEKAGGNEQSQKELLGIEGLLKELLRLTKPLTTDTERLEHVAPQSQD